MPFDAESNAHVSHEFSVSHMSIGKLASGKTEGTRRIRTPRL